MFDVTIKTVCVNCTKEESLEVNLESLINYLNGELVQNSFSEKTKAEREIIIGFRMGGHHTCDTCWTNMASKEDTF